MFVEHGCGCGWLHSYGRVCNGRIGSRRSLGRVIEDAESDAIRFIVEHLLLPVFDARKSAAVHEGAYVGNRLAGGRITDLNERDGDEAWLTQATDRFCDEPLAV